MVIAAQVLACVRVGDWMAFAPRRPASARRAHYTHRHGMCHASSQRQSTDGLLCVCRELTKEESGESSSGRGGYPQARRRGFLIGYPVNPIIEAAAEVDIRTIIVRQERTGLHMADAVSRVTSGERIGVFAMQHGPGAENSFGGVAQAFGDSVPIVVLPGGYPRRLLNIPPNFSSFLNYQHVTKWAEQVILADVGARRHAARVHAGAQWPPATRPGRASLRPPARRGAGRLDLYPGTASAQRARSARRRRGRGSAGGGRAAGDLCGSGRALCARMAATARAGRAAGGAGDDEPPGQERVSRRPSAVARLRRTRDLANRCTIS